MRRRDFLGGIATLAASAGTVPAQAAARTSFAGLRGSLDATGFGVRPGSYDDQSRLLQKALNAAAAEDKPVFLPPGLYVASNIELPDRTRLMGVPGASRIIFAGGSGFLSGTGCERVELDGITLDGANRPMPETMSALLNLRACPRVSISNSTFIGSQANGITLDTCGGRLERSRISGAGGVAGLYSVNATGFSIRDNEVSDCANGGILVHRWQIGEDNTQVTGNRVERIAARDGGTGQRGNGVNLFRANGVMVTNNHISDCAFSAIRANSASNAQITGNTNLRSGETAIYAEFAFEGSLIANNIVDGGTIGISIANFNEGGRLAVCANNLIRNMVTDGPYPAEVAGFGIGIFAEADTSVTGNVIEGAPQYGIGLGWGPYLRNVVASNNIVRDAGQGIAVSIVKGAGQASITGNMFDRVKHGGIFGHRWRDRATGDLAGGNRRPYSHLLVERNTVNLA